MLAALMGGQSLTASELADLAHVSRATASGHLAKLSATRLVAVTSKRSFRYYRLASPLVAQMLESIKLVAALEVPPRYQPRSARDEALRLARTCYDHIAGRLGVAIADALAASGATTSPATSAPKSAAAVSSSAGCSAGATPARCASRQSVSSVSRKRSASGWSTTKSPRATIATPRRVRRRQSPAPPQSQSDPCGERHVRPASRRVTPPCATRRCSRTARREAGVTRPP
jgi:DNA-binding transcriptional ArsR family regulator